MVEAVLIDVDFNVVQILALESPLPEVLMPVAIKAPWVNHPAVPDVEVGYRVRRFLRLCPLPSLDGDYVRERMTGVLPDCARYAYVEAQDSPQTPLESPESDETEGLAIGVPV